MTVETPAVVGVSTSNHIVAGGTFPIVDAHRDPVASLDLADYRRRVFELYGRVRSLAPGEAWISWRDIRDRRRATHPQSALEPGSREAFEGLSYFPYDPAWRIEARVEGAGHWQGTLAHSGSGTTAFHRIGTVAFTGPSGDISLPVYWLDAYGGGVFLPFRDGTAGTTTYGGGRYLLDTAKGADLGMSGDRLILDFNFAYHPSCVYSDRWSCPLAPEETRITALIEAGERLQPA